MSHFCALLWFYFYGILLTRTNLLHSCPQKKRKTKRCSWFLLVTLWIADCLKVRDWSQTSLFILTKISRIQPLNSCLKDTRSAEEMSGNYENKVFGAGTKIHCYTRKLSLHFTFPLYRESLHENVNGTRSTAAVIQRANSPLCWQVWMLFFQMWDSISRNWSEILYSTDKHSNAWSNGSKPTTSALLKAKRNTHALGC